MPLLLLLVVWALLLGLPSAAVGAEPAARMRPGLERVLLPPLLLLLGQRGGRPVRGPTGELLRAARRDTRRLLLLLLHTNLLRLPVAA